jgi:glucose-6-phosphate dehydrogenase assembly protein OpcA
MTTLWDTSGSNVVKALAAERRTYGGVTSGLALTLMVVSDEKHVTEAETAATIAASRHPCRVLVVVRRQLDAPIRLDAEVSVGGRLGPVEAVVMRMYGRLILHAESVTLPLLAPDVPVVTWWHSEPPDVIGHDPLGVVADRRVTDCAQAPDPVAALRRRAEDYQPGDTDLAWTRTTPWRSLLAGAFDTVSTPAVGAAVTAGGTDPSAFLLGGWLGCRLGVPVRHETGGAAGVHGITLHLADGTELAVRRSEGRSAVLSRTGAEDRTLPLSQRDLGDELAEELRRIDPDEPYADALAAATGVAGLSGRVGGHTHIWRDPEQDVATAVIGKSA